MRARHAALVEIIYHTCRPIPNSYLTDEGDTRIIRVRHARQSLQFPVSKYLLSTYDVQPLYIGHIYVIRYTTYI